ncbi:MAG: 30S ribosome-binding factor RbfA [Verrucomicrobiales bacterium]
MSQRLLRVRELLKREIGLILSRDYDFNALVTINAVDVTPDLRKGHVFIGIIGADGRDNAIVARLNRERGNIQRRLAKRVVLKFTPQLHFKVDGSVERGVRTLALLEALDDKVTDVAGAQADLSADEDGEEGQPGGMIADTEERSDNKNA